MKLHKLPHLLACSSRFLFRSSSESCLCAEDKLRDTVTLPLPPPPLRLGGLEAAVTSWRVGIGSYLTCPSRRLVMVMSTFRVFTSREERTIKEDVLKMEA